MGLMKKLFGSHSDRELKKIYPIADKVMALDETYGKLTDEELKGKTPEFKARLAAGETLDDILPEAFAVSVTGCHAIKRLSAFTHSFSSA